ncbi:MAG: hypothetical protein GY804_01360 [Alphaproteobacteria bacterium]|nr:hypothetical protein [Alphaproteobacteria bacterium]
MYQVVDNLDYSDLEERFGAVSVDVPDDGTSIIDEFEVRCGDVDVGVVRSRRWCNPQSFRKYFCAGESSAKTYIKSAGKIRNRLEAQKEPLFEIWTQIQIGLSL